MEGERACSNTELENEPVATQSRSSQPPAQSKSFGGATHELDTTCMHGALKGLRHQSSGAPPANRGDTQDVAIQLGGPSGHEHSSDPSHSTARTETPQLGHLIPPIAARRIGGGTPLIKEKGGSEHAGRVGSAATRTPACKQLL